MLVLYVVPQPFGDSGQALYQASLLPDVTPARRLALTGDLRIDLPVPRRDNRNPREAGCQRGFSCDHLCLGLLFTPGVSSVTLNRTGSGFDPEARTYRLTPRAECAGAGLLPDLDGRSGLFPGPFEEGRALV